MRTVIDMILASMTTWYLLWIHLYSPEAQIKRLWKEILRISEELARYANVDTSLQMNYILKDKSNRRGRIINALLEMHFDKNDDDDLEFINDNWYEEK